jgi:hypothetical protein
MTRTVWLTDLHLNFLDRYELEAFCREVTAADPDAVLITGDISDAPAISKTLRLLARQWARPIHFVLGNHDFYHGSLPGIRRQMQQLCSEVPQLHWLPGAGVVELTPDTALIGHDSWADGRLGLGMESAVLLNDYFYIQEFVDLDLPRRFQLLASLGDEAAQYFQNTLPIALGRYQKVIILMHAPPFAQACTYEGHPTNEEVLPHFCCKVVGEVIYNQLANRPDNRAMVLCGHTHYPADVKILPNLRVLAGKAEYGMPEIQRVMELKSITLDIW